MTKLSAEGWRNLAAHVTGRDADVFKSKAKAKSKWQKGSAELGDPKDVEHEDDDLGEDGGTTGSGNKKQTASTSGLKQPKYTTPTVKGAGT
jgi:hypothetical protein